MTPETRQAAGDLNLYFIGKNLNKTEILNFPQNIDKILSCLVSYETTSSTS